jgi:4-hydroxy-tetrahydrodipicolinate synthase
MTGKFTSESAHGLFVPLVTPFNEEGQVDAGSLSALTKHLLSQPGVTGLVTCARIGEGPVLTLEEQIEVTRLVKEAAGPDVAIIGSILPATAADAVVQIDELDLAGADAVMVFPPLLLGWGNVPDSVKLEFYRDLDAGSSLPIILFQTPMRDYRFSVEVIREIAKLPSVVAMKEASFDMNAYESTTSALQDDGSTMAILNGNDRFVALGSVLGASGALIGIANLVPSAWAELIDLAANGQVPLALEKEHALRKLQDVVFCEPILDAVARIKVILKAEGIIESGHVRRPQLGISDAEAVEVLRAYHEFVGALV